MEKLRAFYKKIFARERLTLAVSSSSPSGFEGELCECIRPSGETPVHLGYSPIGVHSEAIEIPAQVGFAALGARLSDAEGKLTGALLVARLILNYEYLWSEVRVKGGAYGVSFRVRMDGGLGFTSYRDPSAEKSLDVFRSAAGFLREFAHSGVDLTKYIIGAVGEFDPYSSVSLKTSAATTNYLTGFTHEDRLRIRGEILKTDADALLSVADMLDRFAKVASPVLVAPASTLDAKPTLFEERLTL